MDGWTKERDGMMGDRKEKKDQGVLWLSEIPDHVTLNGDWSKTQHNTTQLHTSPASFYTTIQQISYHVISQHIVSCVMELGHPKKMPKLCGAAVCALLQGQTMCYPLDIHPPVWL